MLLLIEKDESRLANSVIEEAKENTPKKYFIEGIFMQAEVKNRNGRVYPKAVMEKAVAEYQPTIDAKRSLGEMMHPAHPQVNLERASHIIESLKWDGDNVVGRARIMTEMPMGKIAKNLIDEGVQLGVSSRGMGTLKNVGGVNHVQGDFQISTVDIVGDPSAHDAWMTAVVEGKEWVFESGIWKEKDLTEAKSMIESTVSKNLVQVQAYLFNKFLSGIK